MLYDGGHSTYDLTLNDGRHLQGNGKWVLDEYQLAIYNDTGSVYVGDFSPGKYTKIDLKTTNGQWALHLTR